MTHFRKKPVVVEAIEFPVTEYSEPIQWKEPIPAWLTEDIETGKIFFSCERNSDYTRMHIPTLEGVMIANPGDMIIRGVKGEIYPCKPEIFAETYVEVKEGEEGIPAVSEDGSVVY